MKEWRAGNFILISGLIQACELSIAIVVAHSCLGVSQGRGLFVLPLRDGWERNSSGRVSVLWYPHHICLKLNNRSAYYKERIKL